jgi:CheY-like chemotaxis protein
MDKKQQIIFVDDEAYWSRHYVAELQKTYEVLYHRKAAGGLQSVHAHPEARLLVLDIMMPAPEDVPADQTENGLSTGIWFLEEIRKIVKERPLPVIVLTNRRLKEVEGALADASIPKGLLILKAKIEVPRFFLPHLVRETIEKHYPPKK